MDKDLITRIVLVIIAVALYLVASSMDFHNSIVAPLTVVVVALVMFWPRRTGERVSTREEIHRIREESKR